MLSDTSTASLASDRQPVADINRDINLNGDQRTVATTPDRIGRRSGALGRCMPVSCNRVVGVPKPYQRARPAPTLPLSRGSMQTSR
jgi:hypothetical protein